MPGCGAGQSPMRDGSPIRIQPPCDRLLINRHRRRSSPAASPYFREPVVRARAQGISYGYRPGKSALDAVGVARQRCWRYAWVLDLDIKAFFDSIETNLLMRAVRKHTD